MDTKLITQMIRFQGWQLGQLSLLSLLGRQIKYWPVWLGLMWGVLTCVGWHMARKCSVDSYRQRLKTFLFSQY